MAVFVSDRLRRLAKVSCVIVLGFTADLVFGLPASALTDFPIGYSSRGGPSAFVSLIEQEHLLEEQGI